MTAGPVNMLAPRVRIKTAEQIGKMRQAGLVVRRVLERLGQMVAPGVTTADLDAEAERLCRESGAEPLFKNFPGRGKAKPFPAVICTSINEQVVHGIPSQRTVLQAGDIVSVDFGVRLGGWCGDATETYAVGPVAPRRRELMDVTRAALDIAKQMVRPGEKWSRVARTMQRHVEAAGFSVVEEFVGHGIGQDMHEEPKIPNYCSRELLARDIHLSEGMVLAVEPMVNAGRKEVRILKDGWTVVTADRQPSAHFEDTLAVVSGGVEVLTA